MQLSNSLAHDRLRKVKTLIVGGGQISPTIVEKIQKQKTHIIETFGMTETASHIAIRPLNGQDKSDYFSALPGVYLTQDKNDCLIIQANHLGNDPIFTNDVVELLSNNAFRWLGRHDNVINTGGIKVFPETIEQKLFPLLAGRNLFIGKIEDAILGQKIILYIEGDPFPLVDDTWRVLTKFEKPGEVRFVEKFRLTESGKIIRRPYSNRSRDS
jgi:O-succinylbenzoic acid--CoA ligase